jgi:aryl-alcohol dehydrogenase
MPTNITAAVARAHKQPFTIETLQLDDIRPNEVRVRLVATGSCVRSNNSFKPKPLRD